MRPPRARFGRRPGVVPASGGRAAYTDRSVGRGRRRRGRGWDVEALTPAPEGLEPIETASPDELQALQLRRLQWSLRHAYDNVPHYRRAFDTAGGDPHGRRALRGPGGGPVTH